MINYLIPVAHRINTLFECDDEKIVSRHQVDRDNVIEVINKLIDGEKIKNE